MFKRLLSAAVAAIAMGGASTAQAQDFYVSGGLGFSHMPDARKIVGAGGLGATSNLLDFDSGYLIHGAVGKRFANNFRAELELGYSENDIGSDFLFAGVIPLDGTGDVSMTTIMANLLHDIDLNDRTALFVGAGLGAVMMDVDFRRGPVVPGFIIADGDDSRFAYQILVGATYDLSDRVELFGRYSYLGMQDSTFTGTNSALGTTSHRFSPNRHAITAGLSVSF